MGFCGVANFLRGLAAKSPKPILRCCSDLKPNPTVTMFVFLNLRCSVKRN